MHESQFLVLALHFGVKEYNETATSQNIPFPVSKVEKCVKV
jgi:hypothetical protein